MNIQQLHIIREASRYAFNLTEVASILGISQPAVSHQVRELEQELGITIFRRHGRRLLGLTPVGEEILVVVERVLNDVQILLQLGKQRGGRAVRPITLATLSTLTSPRLTRVLHGLPDELPGIRLSLQQSTGQPLLLDRLLRNGELDAALTLRPAALAAELTFTPCCQVPLQLLFPAGHPLLAIDSINLFHLAAFPLIAPPDDDVVGQQIRSAFAATGVEAQVVLATRDPALIRHYVEQDLGIGVVPGLLEPVTSTLVYRDAGAMFAPLEIGLLHPRHLAEEPAIQDWLREMQRALRQCAADSHYRRGTAATSTIPPHNTTASPGDSILLHRPSGSPSPS